MFKYHDSGNHLCFKRRFANDVSFSILSKFMKYPGFTIETVNYFTDIARRTEAVGME